jgi:hypothetical protein
VDCVVAGSDLVHPKPKAHRIADIKPSGAYRIMGFLSATKAVVSQQDKPCFDTGLPDEKFQAGAIQLAR